MRVHGKLHEISIAFGEKNIIEKATADIVIGTTVGIVGGNGAGKSSLLSVLSGEEETSSGQIEWFGNIPSILIFKQEDDQFVLNNLAKNEWEYLSKWPVPKDRAYADLSGGEKMKTRLTQIFAAKPQLLLLDEPTNHLDQESLAFLKEQVNSYSGTIILVSHDRYFLDEVADTIWEIENKKLTVYAGNYSAYLQKKEELHLTQQRLYNAQQSKIQQVGQQMAQLRDWSTKAHVQSTKEEGTKEYHRVKAKKMDVRIRSKQKRLELELSKLTIEKPEEEKAVLFSIDGNKKKGNRVIEAKGMSKSFGTQLLFQNASFTVQSQERIALLGANGSGKSTFFRMLMGEETVQGELWKSSAMNIGYLRQTVFDLPESKTPFEFFGPTDFTVRGQIQTLMMNLGFSKDQWTRPISTMSMGERVKLKLMEFILDQKDVLLLDEPTNHLDLPSREQLEKTLFTFPGTILLVTHDRYFLEKLTNKLLIFEQKTIRKVEIPYKEWTNKNNESSREKELLKLDTERQAVLGKLSYLQRNDSKYNELDQKFLELTKQINELKDK
ncbi:ribosomal protection-like ABC-F family protein [Psychrobacillus sp.]|uniref:ribosomal protection-like ABC-F family protein n=1 Tax=Psychrobacillus sp. TaxID=1871623 RepID=UPI0028BF5679|nr:ABC-F family ATP-binding cassette domain-containing protein [Psychrobacillus sp.]